MRILRQGTRRGQRFFPGPWSSVPSFDAVSSGAQTQKQSWRGSRLQRLDGPPRRPMPANHGWRRWATRLDKGHPGSRRGGGGSGTLLVPTCPAGLRLPAPAPRCVQCVLHPPSRKYEQLSQRRHSILRSRVTLEVRCICRVALMKRMRTVDGRSRAQRGRQAVALQSPIPGHPHRRARHATTAQYPSTARLAPRRAPPFQRPGHTGG